ncbi:hypothetical protein GQ42DRAFT_37858 [Ramicandelaber brevisporus]|nr:hypothetical protein GQ42DRAFT_37858 [Ramicandelaber brevisporus]
MQQDATQLAQNCKSKSKSKSKSKKRKQTENQPDLMMTATATPPRRTVDRGLSGRQVVNARSTISRLFQRLTAAQILAVLEKANIDPVAAVTPQNTNEGADANDDANDDDETPAPAPLDVSGMSKSVLLSRLFEGPLATSISQRQLISLTLAAITELDSTATSLIGLRSWSSYTIQKQQPITDNNNNALDASEDEDDLDYSFGHWIDPVYIEQSIELSLQRYFSRSVFTASVQLDGDLMWLNVAIVQDPLARNNPPALAAMYVFAWIPQTSYLFYSGPPAKRGSNATTDNDGIDGKSPSILATETMVVWQSVLSILGAISAVPLNLVGKHVQSLVSLCIQQSVQGLVHYDALSAEDESVSNPLAHPSKRRRVTQQSIQQKQRDQDFSDDAALPTLEKLSIVHRSHPAQSHGENDLPVLPINITFTGSNVLNGLARLSRSTHLAEGHRTLPSYLTGAASTLSNTMQVDVHVDITSSNHSVTLPQTTDTVSNSVDEWTSQS